MLATIRSRTSCFLVCCLKNINMGIYKTIILPVVLHRCETWSLTLREKYRLRVFENRALRRIFGSKRDEMTRGWENCNMRSFITCTPSPSTVRMIKWRRMRWAWHVARMEATRNAYRILVGKPEGKRPLGRRRRRWMENTVQFPKKNYTIDLLTYVRSWALAEKPKNQYMSEASCEFS
jgi:hypothetical protein